MPPERESIGEDCRGRAVSPTVGRSLLCATKILPSPQEVCAGSIRCGNRRGRQTVVDKVDRLGKCLLNLGTRGPPRPVRRRKPLGPPPLSLRFAWSRGNTPRNCAGQPLSRQIRTPLSNCGAVRTGNATQTGPCSPISPFPFISTDNSAPPPFPQNLDPATAREIQSFHRTISKPALSIMSDRPRPPDERPGTVTTPHPGLKPSPSDRQPTAVWSLPCTQKQDIVFRRQRRFWRTRIPRT